MIIRRENLGDILPFIQRCEEIGAHKIYYDLDANLGNDRLMPDPEFIDALAQMKYECEKRGFEAACAEAGTNAFSTEVASHVERAYDELIRRDAEAGERMQVLRDMENLGIDWRFYALVTRRLGQDFGAMVDAAVGAGR
jgi:hypothetical protein